MPKSSVLAAFAGKRVKTAKHEFTHNELVLRACQWLRTRGCKIVMAEPGILYTQSPDVLGYENALNTHQVECKVTRSDFKADAEKRHRKFQSEDQLGNYRWYLTPRGLLKPEELPAGWGLVEVTAQKAFVIQKSVQFKHAEREEAGLLFHALQRIQTDHFQEAYASPEAFMLAKIWGAERRLEGVELPDMEEVELPEVFPADMTPYKNTYLGRAAGSSAANLSDAVYGHRAMIAQAMTEDELRQVLGTIDALVKFTHTKLHELRKEKQS